MSRFRIVPIEGVPGCVEVLVAMFEDMEGEVYLEMSAWHLAADGEKHFQCESFYMQNEMMMEAFIENIHPHQCAAWAKKFHIEEMVPLNEQLG